MKSQSKRGAKRRTLRLDGIELNSRQQMGGANLLGALPDRCASLGFLDPQYRAVLDRQRYGNEGARQKGRSRLPQMTDATIAHFVEEFERILKPSGHLCLWIDTFTLAEAIHHRWFRHAPSLRRVGLFHWNKTMWGMGARFRQQSEYLVLVQKEPLKAKAVFSDRSFPDTLPEQVDRGGHPHAKPRGITLRLIRTLSKRGDLVVDPCAGSYGVLDLCQIAGRDFVGCDLLP